MTLGLIPKYADRLLALRLDGKDPDEMVILSLDGLQTQYIDNYQMVADPRKRYDWRLLAGLEVCVLIRRTIPGLLEFLQELAMGVKPGRLYLWDIDAHCGGTAFVLPNVDTIDRPPPQWKWELDVIPWLPIQNDRFLNGEPQTNAGMPKHGIFFARSNHQTVVKDNAKSMETAC